MESLSDMVANLAEEQTTLLQVQADAKQLAAQTDADIELVHRLMVEHRSSTADVTCVWLKELQAALETEPQEPPRPTKKARLFGKAPAPDPRPGFTFAELAEARADAVRQLARSGGTTPGWRLPVVADDELEHFALSRTSGLVRIVPPEGQYSDEIWGVGPSVTELPQGPLTLLLEGSYKRCIARMQAVRRGLARMIVDYDLREYLREG